jgi:hypothetical protein
MKIKPITMKPCSLRQAVLLGLLVCSSQQASALNYTFSDLGTITGPYVGNSAIATQINNLGQVAGYDNTSALIWNGNTITRLDDRDLASRSMIPATSADLSISR